MKLKLRTNYPDVGISAFCERSDHLSDYLVVDGQGIVHFSNCQQTLSLHTKSGDSKLAGSKHTGKNVSKFLSLCQL